MTRRPDTVAELDRQGRLAVRLFAAILWLAFAASIWSMLAGNPTAINGVIGAGGSAVIVTALAFIDAAIQREYQRSRDARQ